MRSMFGFIWRWLRPVLLMQAQAAVERVAHVSAVLPDSPAELARRDQLLRRMRGADLTQTPTFKRLDFLQRLRRGLATSIADEAVAGFLAEAKALDLEDNDGIRLLRRHLRLCDLKTGGPHPIERDADGRGVYHRCGAEYRKRDGTLEVTTAGVTFTGEVLVSIPWSKVLHVAHVNDDGEDVIALQERGRKTASKFGFYGADSTYAGELDIAVWNRHRASGAITPSDSDTTVTIDAPGVAVDLGMPGGDCDFHIVGESNYQPELRDVSHSGREFTARVEHEPKTRFDPNAVRVCSPRGRTIGYFSREHALDYRTCSACWRSMDTPAGAPPS
jgi:hypothetical protein